MALAATVFAYLIVFPEDLAAVIAPAKEILTLTEAVSPWFYAALTGGAVCWTIVRCFGRRTDVSR
jgi:Na+-driven multidrug efflux pump